MSSCLSPPSLVQGAPRCQRITGDYYGDTSRCVGLDGKSSAALCIVIGSLCPCTTQKEKSFERMARRYDMHLAQSADADRMPSGGSEHSTAGACFRMPDNGWLRVVF